MTDEQKQQRADELSKQLRQTVRELYDLGGKPSSIRSVVDNELEQAVADNTPAYKEYKVAEVSSNTNEFGLRGHILVARDGEAWQVGLSYLNSLEQDAVVAVPMRRNGEPDLVRKLSAEIPERIAHPPAEVLRKIWGEEAQPA